MKKNISKKFRGALRPAIAERIGFLLNHSAFRIRVMTGRILEPFEIIPRHYGMLATIHSLGSPTQHEIGDLLKIDRTTIMSLVDELEKKGFVIRGGDPEDRRCHRIYLSSAGKELFKKATRSVLEAEEKFLATLSGVECKQFRRILVKLFYSIPPQERLMLHTRMRKMYQCLSNTKEIRRKL